MAPLGPTFTGKEMVRTWGITAEISRGVGGVFAVMSRQHGKSPHGWCGGGVAVQSTGGAEEEMGVNLGTAILPPSLSFSSLSPFPSFPPFPFLLTFSSASPSSLGFEEILDADGMEVIFKLDCIVSGNVYCRP